MQLPVSIKDLRFGLNPALDAWILHFMNENNIDPHINPQENASPEQIRFMVDLQDDQVFAPCSDEMLTRLLASKPHPELLAQYEQQWKDVTGLIHKYITDPYIRERVLHMSRYQFDLAKKSLFLIPSRLKKQLTTIFLTQCGTEDPMTDEKKTYNKRAADFLVHPSTTAYLDACPALPPCLGLNGLRTTTYLIEIKRLLALSTLKEIWQKDGFTLSETELARLKQSEAALDATLEPVISILNRQKLKIMFLPDCCGGLMIDIQMIRLLLRYGHSVTLALNEGFFFDMPTFWDVEQDMKLEEALADALLESRSDLSKNELLAIQRQNNFQVISNGTRERLNLYRTNVTFARVWKEADLIVAKGEANYRRLILNSHSFTCDIFSFYRDNNGKQHAFFKPRSARVRKFTEKQILVKSEEIMNEMRAAKMRGERVMFYSAIVGSIPGQTSTAITILNAFVSHLRARLEGMYIINPAEYFEQGMDGDDLMFMWEHVQRSGLIDVWRFQTGADIERSFELMGQKVPSLWTGKDATYSTGCTKEMHIAIEEQQKHPELQIIGPDPKKFFRRREYGVGKFFDSSIEKV